jgi:D-3-phosphoglycerate dehydrogenase
MKQVLLSQEIHPEGRKLLDKRFDVSTVTNPDEKTVASMAKNADAIVLRTNLKITKSIILNAPKLKIISRTGAGVDNIDIDTATKQGILVCNLPGVNNVSVCEHTISMMLCLAKQLAYMDKSVRNGNWKARRSNLSVEMDGKILGVVGLGKIGALVAKKCHNAFNMKILAFDPYLKDKFQNSEYEFVDDLKTLFRNSDFITLHCPDTPQTRGMVTEDLLYSMKKTAYLINAARGSLMDERALVKVLKEKRIAGAGIDVFTQEPPSPDNELLKLENIMLSPHSAALTKEASERMAVKAVEAVIDYFEGRQPKYIFNHDELLKRNIISE